MPVRLLSCLLLLVLARTSFTQSPIPAPPQAAPILILGATAHLGDGRVIPNSAIAFDKGKITLVTDASTARFNRNQFGKIFDATGKHIYPGFIATDTRLGILEIDAVRATQDFAEVGDINPNARTIIAYNTDSDVIPTVRSNGILLAQVTPTGGRMPGTSAIVQLDAWNWEDATVRSDDGVHLNWPVQRMGGGGRRGRTQAPQEEADPYEDQLRELQRFFDEARAYCQTATPAALNLRFEAMRGIFNGTQKLYIHTDQARSMQEAVLFAERYGIPAVLVGAADAWLITDFLKSHQTAVILRKSQRLPSREDEDIDQPFKTAAALQAAGIVFCLSEDGTWRQRNLAFQAGQCVGFGLPYEAAVGAITLNAAKILGIDNRCGSLEAGKDATLFISEGDALDMRSCQVTAAFIEGREIDLDNKQKELNRRFEAKYRKPGGK